MPFIHIRSYSGRDLEGKKKAVEAIVNAAVESMGSPITAFTVVFEDIDRESWAEEAVPIIEALQDKMIMDHGKMLV